MRPNPLPAKSQAVAKAEPDRGSCTRRWVLRKSLCVIDCLDVSGCVDGISDDSTRSGNDFPIDGLGISSATQSRLRHRYFSVFPNRNTNINIRFLKATRDIMESSISDKVQRPLLSARYTLWMPTVRLMPRLFSITLTFPNVAAARSTRSEIEVTSAAYSWDQSPSSCPKLSLAAAN